MKKYIYFLIIFIFTPSVYFYSDDGLFKIYYTLAFDDDVKINGKTLVSDLSSDILKFIKRFDLTSDLPKSSKIIYKDKKKDKYKEIENLLNDNLSEKLKLKNNFEDFTIIKSTMDLSALDGVYFDIKIREYTEGEYNLIKNRNSIVKLLVKIYKKDSKSGIFLLQRWYYFCKSDINFPTEYIRIENISDRIADEFLLKIKRILKKT